MSQFSRTSLKTTSISTVISITTRQRNGGYFPILCRRLGVSILMILLAVNGPPHFLADPLVIQLRVGAVPTYPESPSK